MHIGHVHIAHPFVQAALSGYSDLPMRRIARRNGADYCVNEVVLDRSVLHDGQWQRQLLDVPDDGLPDDLELLVERDVETCWHRSWLPQQSDSHPLPLDQSYAQSSTAVLLHGSASTDPLGRRVVVGEATAGTAARVW